MKNILMSMHVPRLAVVHGDIHRILALIKVIAMVTVAEMGMVELNAPK